MSTPVNIERHPSERRRSSAMVLYGPGCCCCCCCLHSLGSLIGAAIAPTVGAKSDAATTVPGVCEGEVDGAFATSLNDPNYGQVGGPIPRIREYFGFSSVAVFWWLTFVLTFLCFAVPVLTETDATVLADRLGAMALFVAMLFPAVQLASAVLTFIGFAAWSRPDRTRQLGQIGKIAAGIFGGAIVGIFAMVAIGAVLGVVR